MCLLGNEEGKNSTDIFLFLFLGGLPLLRNILSNLTFVFSSNRKDTLYQDLGACFFLSPSWLTLIPERTMTTTDDHRMIKCLARLESYLGSRLFSTNDEFNDKNPRSRWMDAGDAMSHEMRNVSSSTLIITRAIARNQTLFNALLNGGVLRYVSWSRAFIIMTALK